MLPYVNLLDMRYCTEYQYLSDKATDFHFKISFGAWVTYKYKSKPSFFQSIKGKENNTEVLQERKVSFSFGLKMVRWYDLYLNQRASIEQEVMLNWLKQNEIDKLHLKQSALVRKKGVTQKGTQRFFPLKRVEVLLENKP